MTYEPGGFSFTDLVDEAVERSGGEASTASDVLKMRRELRIMTERWMAQGYNTWKIKVMTMTFRGGDEGTLKLPACVDDVINVSASQTNDVTNRSTIKRITAAQHAALTRDITQGRPSQYWLNRIIPCPVLHLYPTSECVLTITYVARPAEYDKLSNVSSEIPGRWLEAMVLGLALGRSRKTLPYDEVLIARLKGEYDEAMLYAQNADRDRARFNYRIA